MGIILNRGEWTGFTECSCFSGICTWSTSCVTASRSITFWDSQFPVCYFTCLHSRRGFVSCAGKRESESVKDIPFLFTFCLVLPPLWWLQGLNNLQGPRCSNAPCQGCVWSLQKGLRQDALGGAPAECEGALSIRVTCVARQSAPMTAFLKRDVQDQPTVVGRARRPGQGWLD